MIVMDDKNSFKAIMSNLDAEYDDRIPIFLESSSDAFIIGRKWFSHLKDNLKFQSVSGKKADGGCQKVLDKVEKLTLLNKKGFGIVDRDILLADPNYKNTLWWEIDDKTFYSSNPYGDNIFVLNHWELENYLFHPYALKELIAEKLEQDPAPLSTQEIADLLTAYEGEFIAVTILSTIPSSKGDRQIKPDQFARQEKGETLYTKVKSKLEISIEEFEIERNKIKSFSEEETDSIRRWSRLSRLLDGKRNIFRINDRLKESALDGKDLYLFNEKGALARHLTDNKELICPFLTQWLTNIHHSANAM